MSNVPYIGHNGFIWFFGTVEDRDDPLRLGRVRVRILNKHTDEILTEDLPWAMPIQEITSSATQSIGKTPTGIQVGSFVFGFFVDAEDEQQPIILGTLAAYTNEQSDLTPLATGNNTVSKTTIGPEPASAFAAQYPFNKVTTTEGGHIIEYDDTPGAERIHCYHKAGSYYEFFPNGDLVFKSIGDAYLVSAGNLKEFCSGNRTTEIQGSDTQTISGSQTLESGSSQTFKAGSSQTFESSSTQTFKPGGNFKVSSGGKVDLNGSSMTWNGQPLVLASGAITGGSF